MCLWRRRYPQESMDRFRSPRHSGRPRSITRAKEFVVVTATMRQPPYATHWSARRLAKQRASAHDGAPDLAQVLAAAPPSRDFQVQYRPRVRRQLADIVGLSLDPPERALVLCVDEKSQIQTIDPPGSSLPLRPSSPSPPLRGGEGLLWVLYPNQTSQRSGPIAGARSKISLVTPLS